MSDSTGRYLPAVDYGRVKAAFRRLLKKVGGSSAAAEITRLDHTRLSRCGSPNEAMFAPIDVIADLEADVDDPIVTRELADLCNHILVPKPETRGDLSDTLALGRAAKETGEALSAWGEALADDGRVTLADEKRLAIRQSIVEALQVLAEMDRHVADLSDADDAE